MATPRTAVKEGEHASDVRFYNTRGKEVFRVGTKDGISVKTADSIRNFLETVPGERTEAPQIKAWGEDANIDIDLVPKGTGVVSIPGLSVTTLTATDIDTATLTATGDITAESDVLVSGSVKGALPSGDWIATYGSGNMLYQYGGSNTNFGWSVSISRDGSTAAFGVPEQYDGGYDNRGATYIYVRDPDTKAWTYQTRVVSATAPNYYEGWSVALSANGHVLVAGAYATDRSYVYIRDPDTQMWSLSDTLTGTAGTDEGYSVSISDDGKRIIAGAIFYDVPTTNCGCVKVYDEDPDNPGTYVQTTVLTQGVAGLLEGSSCAISGDGNTIVSDGRLWDSPATNSGRTHIYTYDPVNEAWDGGQICQTATQLNALEGRSVHVSYDGNRVVSGASGPDKVYVYNRDTATGLFNSAATGTDILSVVGMSGGDTECVRISSDGNTIVVGCNDLNVVRVFNLDTNGDWVVETTLTEGLSFNQGKSVAVANPSANELIILCGDDLNNSIGAGFGNVGGVYVYDYTNTGIEFQTGNGETMLKVVGAEIDGMNYPRLEGGAFGQGPALVAAGDQADIDLELKGKGTGVVHAENFRSCNIETKNIEVDGLITGNLDVGDWIATRGSGNELTTAPSSGREGYSVAISKDGSTLAAGAYYMANGGAINSGGVYIYDRDPSTGVWSAGTLLQTAASNYSYEGYAVALSQDGNVCVAGAPGNGATLGRNYLYIRTAGIWSAGTQYQQTGNNYEGTSVSISDDGTRFVSGARDYDTVASNAGCNFVYDETTPGVYALSATLSQNESDAWEGYSVAISGDGNTIVASNHLYDTVADVGRTVIYTYDTDTSVWDAGQVCRTATLASSFESISVDVNTDGSRVISAANGPDVVYVYDRDVDYGTFPATATATLSAAGMAAGDSECLAISPNGNTIMVGCRDVKWTRIFNVDPDGTWDQNTYLTENITGIYQGKCVSFANYEPNKYIVATGAFGLGSSTGGTFIYEYTNTGLEFRSGNDETILKIVASELENVNYPRLEAAVALQGPTLSAAGDDANIDLELKAKGTGTVHAENFRACDIETKNIEIDGRITGNLDVGDWIATRGFDNPLEQDSNKAWEGYSVAISADGNTLAAGAVGYDVVATDGGAVFIYTRNPDSNVWTYEDILQTAAVNNDNEGRSVALSADGNVCIAGAIGVASQNGAVYVYIRTGGTWSAGTLISSPADAGAQFGVGVSISDDGKRFVVGAQLHDTPAANCGAVYVYDEDPLSPGTYSLADTLQQGTSNYNEGYSVAISGDGNTIAAGAIQDTGSDDGRTIIYTRDILTGVWDAGQECKTSSPDDQEGFAVDVNYDGSFVVSGAHFNDLGGSNAGAIVVYERDPDTGNFPASSSFLYITGTTYGGEGVAISPDGNTVVMGAPAGSTTKGSVHIWVRDDNGNWTEEAGFTHTANDQRMGKGVSLAYKNGDPSKQILAVGAFGHVSSDTFNGGTYIYETTNAGLEFRSGENDTILKVVASEQNNVNYPRLEGATTEQAPTLAAAGADTDIDLRLQPKGDGVVVTNTIRTTDLLTSFPLAQCHVTTPAGVALNTISFTQFGGTFLETQAAYFTVDTSGNMTYIGDRSRFVQIVASLSFSLSAGPQDIEVAVFRNSGVVQASVITVSSTTTKGAVTLQLIDGATTDDVYSLRARCASGTPTATLDNCNFAITALPNEI